MKHKYVPVDAIVGLHNLPDGLRGHDILWDWDPGHEPETPAQVQAKWNKWRRVRDEIQNEWRREAKALLEEALAGLAQDKRELAIIAEMERREEWYRKDAEDTSKYVAGLLALEDKAWKKEASAKANRVGDQIRKSDAAAAKRTIREQLERLGKPTRNTVLLNLELPI